LLSLDIRGVATAITLSYNRKKLSEIHVFFEADINDFVKATVFIRVSSGEGSVCIDVDEIHIVPIAAGGFIGSHHQHPAFC
jgi:hypothetical protein